jgi:hypothetical protein
LARLALCETAKAAEGPGVDDDTMVSEENTETEDCVREIHDRPTTNVPFDGTVANPETGLDVAASRKAETTRLLKRILKGLFGGGKHTRYARDNEDLNDELLDGSRKKERLLRVVWWNAAGTHHPDPARSDVLFVTVDSYGSP